jgi:hypothetical protein
LQIYRGSTTDDGRLAGYEHGRHLMIPMMEDLKAVENGRRLLKMVLMMKNPVSTMIG